MRFSKGLWYTALSNSYDWKRKTAVDNRGIFAALLTDLSKVFDYSPHDLLTAKLAAYSFDTNALKLIHNYLPNRKQRVKVNSAYSIWKDIFYGVQQGSILGSLLFNIHLRDLFHFLENIDIASYADDTTLYSAQKNRETVINTIETSLKFFMIGLVTVLWKLIAVKAVY